MNKIKSVKDLPSWFSTGNYKDNINEQDWYREVARRSWVMSSIEKRSLNPGYLGSSKAIEDSERFVIASWKPNDKRYTVLQNFRAVRDMSEVNAVLIGSCCSQNEKTTSAIQIYRLQLLLELFQFEKLLLKNGKKDLSIEYKHKAWAYWHEFVEKANCPSLAHQAVENFGNPFLYGSSSLEGYPLVINMDHSDELIVTAFNDWLGERRRLDKEKSKRRFTEKQFSDWSLFKIRQVFDLDIWAKLNMVKITDNVMAKAIWSNNASGSPIDVLRTTSRGKVNEIFQPDVVARFRNQLILEKGENFLQD